MVFVTGSSKGNEIARWIVQKILQRHRIKSIFVDPKRWEYHRPNLKEMTGLVLLGGKDINPQLYGKAQGKQSLDIDSKRDTMELSLLSEATKSDIPCFGICRGMQMINIYYGGSLYLHLNDLSLKEQHRNPLLPLKHIEIIKGTKLYEVIGQDKIRVNALHHQGIERLGEDITQSAYDNNGTIEAIEHQRAKFVMGVQWHPEYMPYAHHTKKLFDAFCGTVITQQSKMKETTGDSFG